MNATTGRTVARRASAAVAAVVTVAAAAVSAGTAPAVAAPAAGSHVTARQHTARPGGVVTLSGRITDGTGHPGWPVYATVSLKGTSVTAFTNPATGQYQLAVPRGGSYTVVADPITPGYEQVTASVTLGASSATWNAHPAVNQITCNAPGYSGVQALSEGFSATSVPAGWTVVTTGSPQNAWVFDGQDPPYSTANDTGSSGNYAMAFENQSGFATDTTLTSPVLNLSASHEPVLRFYQYADDSGTARQEADVSLNGGKTWADAWAAIGSDSATPIVLPLPQAAGKPSVRLRFQYTDDGSSGGDAFDAWQVDGVTMTSCVAAAGGLVVGRVTDANTGGALDGATVTSGDQPGQAASTVATPGDSAVNGGLYWLFSSLTGRRPFTAAAPEYASQAASLTIGAGHVTQASFSLDAGRVVLASAPVTATAKLGGQATATATVRNTGTAPATVTLTPTWPAGAGQSGNASGATAAPAAPVQRVSFGGHFVPRIAALVGAARTGASAQAPVPAAEGAQASTPWVTPADLPEATEDTAAATDPATGTVYVAGGSTSSDGAIATAYVLDPATGQWHALPPMSHARAGDQAAFISGKLYVTGGWDDSANADPVASTEIYDPVVNSWSAGAAVPYVYFGAATAVLGGKMYLVGGCDVDLDFCGEDTVQVYNPASNEWNIAAPYPAQVGYPACAALAGELYCAGGVNDLSGTTSAGYVYNPRANAWSPIPHMPADLWGSAYTAANGLLLVSGGWTDESSVLTNQGYTYDPATDAWSALPDAPGSPAFGSAAACGFYRIGGMVDPDNAAPTAAVTELPGFGGCGGQPWLSAEPSSVTIAPGHSATVTVTLNAATALISQPGVYTGALWLGSATPYPVPKVQVKLTAAAPAGWGQITGTVTGLSCAGTTGPLAGVTVQISGKHGVWFPETGSSGRYSLWLDSDNGTATVIVGPSGWQPDYARLTVKPNTTAARTFRLAPAGGCS